MESCIARMNIMWICVKNSAIDDDRWAKHPYGVKFDDPECDDKYGVNGLNGRDECYRMIERARNAGYEIDSDVEEYFY